MVQIFHGYGSGITCDEGFIGSIFMLPSWLQIEPKVVYRHRLSSHLSSTFKLLASRFRFADFFSLEFSLSSSNLFLSTETSL